MLYKLLKILNGWQDDSSATIDQEGSHHTTYNDIAIGIAQAEWKDGYYDSTQNDLISDNNYIRTRFLNLSDSARYGEVVRLTINSPSDYKYKVHWFSYVDNTSQTFLSESSWITGTGSNRTFTKPSSATYFMVSVTSSNSGTSGSTHTEDWSYESSSWRQGKIGDDGTVDTSNTSYVYTNGYTDVTGVGLDHLDISTTSGTLYAAVFYYDSSRNFLGYDGYEQYDTTFEVAYDRIRASKFPSGTKYIRWCVTTSSTTTTSDGAKLKIIASFVSGGGDAIDPADGASISMFKTFMKDEYIPPITDVNKWTVDYTDAVLSCYNQDVVTDPMLDRAPMKVTLENTRGTASTMVEEKDSAVPELVVVDGENEFTVEGDGTYRIQFKRGSL